MIVMYIETRTGFSDVDTRGSTMKRRPLRRHPNATTCFTRGRIPARCLVTVVMHLESKGIHSLLQFGDRVSRHGSGLALAPLMVPEHCDCELACPHACLCWCSESAFQEDNDLEQETKNGN